MSYRLKYFFIYLNKEEELMEFRERKNDNDHMTNGVTLTVDNFYLISHL